MVRWIRGLRTRRVTLDLLPSGSEVSPAGLLLSVKGACLPAGDLTEGIPRGAGILLSLLRKSIYEHAFLMSEIVICPFNVFMVLSR
jgi:hypothetical protein